ncbi:CarD family transcriptional regulator [Hydrogenispora ethanolica]|jgi:CarD family transcriptional regulator|uniref:CarD family transcriptional regulator n=1 Tax=Hydrogenispora ethanolica TaxID=1082276 RepID=A0A4R1RAP2_HYDET|nr:CarD family transcriptional regulator [Hydrogenispora ethanolica]TCL62805.1 CarD family transcriptional regulator [Hydrogenispora ethanolica]
MFNVGDKVVYPMHGAGVIEDIEEQEVSGERVRYYIIKLPMGEMKAMVPLNKVKEVGLRQIIDEEEILKVFEVLKDKTTSMPINWNHRYRANLEKIKSGSIFEVAEVVRNLVLRDRQKGLSTGEKKMLENARRILLSELVLAKNVSENMMAEMIDDFLS